MRPLLLPLTAVALASASLQGCDLKLDKSLLDEQPALLDASGGDASVDVEAGKEASAEAEAGKLDGNGDALKTDSDAPDSDASDAVEADVTPDAACEPPTGSNLCIQCAMAHCCPQINACVQDQQCAADLAAYLDCTNSAGTGCIMVLWQSTNAADVDLMQCLSPACELCNQT